jgi:hypothetical protein
MARTSAPRFTLARIVRRADARRAAAAALALAAAGPTLAQAPVPVGGEFRGNTTTAGDQRDVAVAQSASGASIAVWTSPDGSGDGIYAQRYAASGAAAGAEFRVNTTTASGQTSPSVSVDADGDALVAWQSFDQDGSYYGVYAQRYAASRVAVGGEFRVNTVTAGNQLGPSVSLDSDGDALVAWSSGGQDGSQYGIYAQRYAGVTVASEPGAPTGLALALAPSPVGAAGAAVRYETPEAGRVRLAVFDVLGREVAVLWDGEQSAGAHEAFLDAGRLAPGVYVVRLEAGDARSTRTVTVVR